MRYQIVIADADVAHQKEIDRNIEANVQAAGPRSDPQRIRRVVERLFTKRPVGTVHTTEETDCPDGMPNCRNCGDPEHAAACAAAGHCPYCGTRHGVAPDRILTANGYVLVED